MPSGTSDVKYVDAYSLPGKPHIAFCDSDDKDILLARHFWLSVHLRPFVESRLVSSDIRQRTIKASLKSQDDYLLRVDHESHALEHLTEFWKKLKNAEYMYQQEFLEGFYKRKKQCKESFLARKSQRINLQEVSGQILQKNRLYSREEEKRWKLEKEIEGPEDVRKQIAEFERKNKIGSVITGLLFHYSRFDERKPIKKVQTKYFEALHKTDDDDEDPCLLRQLSSMVITSKKWKKLMHLGTLRQRVKHDCSKQLQRDIDVFDLKHHMRNPASKQPGDRDRLRSLGERKSGPEDEITNPKSLQGDFERFQTNIQKFQRNISQCEEKHDMLHKLTGKTSGQKRWHFDQTYDNCVTVENTEKAEEPKENTENFDEMDTLENDDFDNEDDCV